MVVPILLWVVGFFQSPVDLKSDERLASLITLEASPKTIRDILQEIQQATNTSLRAEKDLEADLCILYARERPAYEVLTVIAEHFGWEWGKAPEGYVLRQSRETKSAEEKERQQEILEWLGQIKESAEKSLKNRETSNFQELLQQYQAIQAKIKERLAQRTSEDEEDEVLLQLQAQSYSLSSALDPTPFLAKLLMLDLTEAQFLELVKKGKLVFSTSPTRAQLALPPRPARFALEYIGQVFRYQQIVMETNPNFTPPDVSALRIVLKMKIPPLGTQVGLLFDPEIECKVQLLRESRILYESSHTFSYTFPYLEELGWELDEELTETEEAKEQVPQEKPKPLPDLPEKFKSPWKPSEEIRAVLLALSGTDEEWSFLFFVSNFFSTTQDILVATSKPLTAFAKDMETPLISDAYDIHAFAFPFGNTSWEQPIHFLEAFAESRSAVLTYAKGWLRLRTTPHALARTSTVPRTLLQEFTELRKTQGGTTLDQLAHFVSQLTEEQGITFLMTHLPEHFFLLPTNAQQTRAFLAFLRTWDSLPQPLKDLLANRTPLRARELPLTTRTHLERLLFLIEDNADWAGYLASDLPTELLQEEPPAETEDTGNREPSRDKEFSQLFPLGLPPDATLTLTRETILGVSARMEVGQATLTMAMSPEAFASGLYGLAMSPEAFASGLYGLGEFLFSSMTPKLSVKPATLELFILEIHLPQNLSRHIIAGGAIADPRIPYGRPEDLPEDLKKRISEASEKLKRLSPPPHPTFLKAVL